MQGARASAAIGVKPVYPEYSDPSSPFYKHALTLIPAWISNPFLNFNSSLEMDI